MSQRNPMNDRYQADDRKGQTRKSAASAKPKSRAAASVRVEPKKKSKTTQEKKAEQKQKQKDLDQRYYNPPTAEYQKWRRIWLSLLVVSIVVTVAAFLVRLWVPGLETLSTILLVPGYAGIIAAVAIDAIKVKKIRHRYQEEMQRGAAKAERAAVKKERAERLAAEKEETRARAYAQARAGRRKSSVEPQKKGLFSFLKLRNPIKHASQTDKAAPQEQKTKK